MHKHPGRLPACPAVVGIVDAAEALDNRAPNPASSPARIPIAVSTAKIAASRRSPNDRPWHAFASAEVLRW
jgi:hypothetical protein